MSRFALIATGVVWLSCCALVRAEQPLYEQDPYDQITLDAANNNAVLKIVPLKTPNHLPPPRGRLTDKLVVHLFETPDKEYTVAWRSIAKVEMFEQLILNKANDFVAKGEFDPAFDYFAYLERNKPGTPGLRKSMEDYLYEEAKHASGNSNTTARWPCCASCTTATRAGPTSIGHWG